ncbi:MAG: VOC family protein [Deltaproteobacteria bacterium]|jgi:catechol 2,3-dioxygenase-like lactoylglutathione lyase family enzyme|nr:VOC family protein [Deltaproteobacteria bacterium]
MSMPGRPGESASGGPVARRRLALRSLALAALVVVLAGLTSAAEPLVTEIGPIGLTVSDADRAAAFFAEVLTFEKVSEVELAGDAFEHLHGVFGARARVVRMRLGEEHIELTEFLAPRGRPIPVDSRSNDHWFQHIAIIVSDMDAAYARLVEHGVTHASTAPQRLPDWNPNAGGIRAFYFEDPDGHPLEILAFPPGKGSPRWHRVSDRLFLGIDHTAIVVGSTEASLRFYRDRLGLEVGGASENLGAEQEHLNNVFGARLRITSLHAARGPSIELLQYLSPSDGRPYPLDAKSNDLVRWRIRLAVADGVAAERELLAGDTPFISPGLVQLGEGPFGFGAGMMLRDPDGHALELVTAR